MSSGSAAGSGTGNRLIASLMKRLSAGRGGGLNAPNALGCRAVGRRGLCDNGQGGEAVPRADVGGVNLFGRGFGNYPQDLVVRLRYV